jgi:alpha-N-arabinofuranosidase
MVLTPTYHVFKMYVPFQDATFLPTQFDAGTYKLGDIEVPRVDAVAAKGADGKVWVALTNLDPHRAVTIDLQVPGVKATRARGETLAAPKFNSINTFEAPQAVKPAAVNMKLTAVKLAPASVTVVSLD